MKTQCSLQRASVIVSISLQSCAVEDDIAFDEGLVRLAIHSFNRWSVEIDLGVDNKERIVGIDDIIIDTDTIKVLLQ